MLNQFLDYLRYELNRAPLTVKAYEHDIRQFMEWVSPNDTENVNFSNVTANDVRAWLASLSKGGDTSRTLRRKIISMRMLFKWMIKKNLIKKSPLSVVPLPKISKPLPDLVKPSEIEEAICKKETEAKEEQPSYIMDALILDMLYSLGIRRAELISLDDSDVSFSKGELKVTGKRSKQRVIPVPEKLLGKIKSWQEYRDKNELKPEDESPLFIKKGKRISAVQVYNIVKGALAQSTARKKSPHALRHSFASGMLNGGAEIDSVREFLGHASLATTQIYTHISLNEIKKAYSTAHPRAGKSKK